MVAKRQATHQQTRAVKKAKLDPVSAKVKEVLDALQRDDCEVGSVPIFREGLMAGFPLAMGLGAAKDERHSYQEQLGNIVLEILQATASKFQESYEAAKGEHAAAGEVESSKAAAVAAAEAALEEHKKVESEAGDTYSSSLDGAMQGRKTLEKASSEVDNFDATQMTKAKERAEYGSALETEFAALKNGAVEDAKEKKALLSTVIAVLQKLGVDTGMVSAATPALTKDATVRGSFDITVVQQVEAALKFRVDSLAEELNDGEAVKASKVAAQAAAQEALTAAEAKVAADETKVSEAVAQTKESKIALKQAKDSLKEQEKIVADLDIKAFYQEAHLGSFREAIVALEFLQRRESAAPEPDADKVVALEAMEEAYVVAA